MTSPNENQTMAELILHHYPNSPFSEKIRLVFGMKGMAWQSVIVPAINPKPDVVALTGRYRRTPFMQIGSDMYCDTVLMCRVIDRLHPSRRFTWRPPPASPRSWRSGPTPRCFGRRCRTRCKPPPSATC